MKTGRGGTQGLKKAILANDKLMLPSLSECLSTGRVTQDPGTQDFYFVFMMIHHLLLHHTPPHSGRMVDSLASSHY